MTPRTMLNQTWPIAAGDLHVELHTDAALDAGQWRQVLAVIDEVTRLAHTLATPHTNDQPDDGADDQGDAVSRPGIPALVANHATIGHHLTRATGGADVEAGPDRFRGGVRPDPGVAEAIADLNTLLSRPVGTGSIRSRIHQRVRVVLDRLAAVEHDAEQTQARLDAMRAVMTAPEHGIVVDGHAYVLTERLAGAIGLAPDGPTTGPTTETTGSEQPPEQTTDQ